jgi:hypothetical protein
MSDTPPSHYESTDFIVAYSAEDKLWSSYESKDKEECLKQLEEIKLIRPGLGWKIYKVTTHRIFTEENTEETNVSVD